MSLRGAAVLVLLGVCNSPPPKPPSQTTPLPDPEQIDPASLATWSWLDAPGRVLASDGVQLVAMGGELLREHDGALLQDGLMARMPSCATDELRDVVEVAGTFPARAVMLRETADGRAQLYRWQVDHWHALATAVAPTALLATLRGDAVHIAGAQRGYTIASALPTRGRMPVPTRDRTDACTTALAEPQGARGNGQGDLVVWGTGCDGAATIEHFPADGSPPRLTRWPDATIGAVDLDPRGRLLAARVAKGATEILVAHDAGWRPLAQTSGHVHALVDAAEAGVFAIAAHDSGEPRLEVWRADRWQPVALGDPRTLARASDGSLWIGTATSLLRTRAPAFEHTLDPRGCDVATVTGAEPYHLRGKRPAGWRCEGGAFVRMLDEASWRAVWPTLVGEIELGFASARRRRGKGDTPLAPGTPIEPIVARELDALYFGFALDGDDELVELAWTELAAKITALGQPLPTPICAAPIGLPEAEVRRLAAP